MGVNMILARSLFFRARLGIPVVKTGIEVRESATATLIRQRVRGRFVTPPGRLGRENGEPSPQSLLFSSGTAPPPSAAKENRSLPRPPKHAESTALKFSEWRCNRLRTSSVPTFRTTRAGATYIGHSAMINKLNLYIIFLR